MRAARTLGVVGAGTMGAGIAQLGAGAGMRTLLYDQAEEALERGAFAVRRGLAKWVEKGRVSEDAAALLEPVARLEELEPCDLVIEATPERADLKRELFTRLSEICRPDAVLATNTSSIPVTSLAGAAERPENVVGMHFFNPAPLMRLVEVIRAEQTGERAVELARATGEAMGKDVIEAVDGPGFLVNRCGRPFYGEGLRILQERAATHEQIDRICRLGGGFRMGPFELMDLVGIDVNLEVAKSFAELSFGEPRWRPSPLQARMVAAGRLGRKTGRGWYEYDDQEQVVRADGDLAPEKHLPPSAIAVLGDGVLAAELRERARAVGHEVRDGGPVELVVDAGIQPHPRPPGGAPLVLLCARSSLAARGEPGAVGFHLVPPLDDVQLVELTRLPTTPSFAAEAAEAFFAGLGFAPEWVEDGPGLVLGRIVAQLVNEAAFAIGEGIGSAEHVDRGLELGLSHPRGPVAWSEAMGIAHVVAILEGLWQERREERYRTAPLLRRQAALGLGLRDAA